MNFTLRYLFFFIVSSPVSLLAQDDFSKIHGKWLEDYRTTFDRKPLNYKDTMRLEIRLDAFVLLRVDNGFNMTGAASFDGKKLSFQEKKFIARQIQVDELVLQDDQAIHHFRRVQEIKLPPIVKLIPGTDSGEVDLSFINLEGKWTCYKKTDPHYASSTFYIKSMDVQQEKSAGVYTGRISFSSSDSVYMTNAFIHITDQALMISTDTENKVTKVLKANNEELILKQGEILYYLKRFSKKN